MDKARRVVEGKSQVKKNKYVDLKAPGKAVIYPLATKHLTVAGIKGYETSRVELAPEQVVGAYRQLFKIEKAFRMAKSDLKARPIYHRKVDSIHAHLTIVMTAMVVGHVLEQASGLQLKRLVRTLRRCRTFTLEVGGQVVHVQSSAPKDVAEMIGHLPGRSG